MTDLKGGEWAMLWYHYFMAAILVCSLIYFTGWFDVLYTKTIGVEKENARREVFEQSQSYVKGKESDALKLYNEYRKCPTEEDREKVRVSVRLMFKDFNEELISSQELRIFIIQCKYKIN